MAADDNLKNLRDQVRKRRNAVTAKENRIKKNTGVDIRGTSEDPRRPVNVVEKYNRKQLIAYLADLNRFMTRSGGFVSGANGVPLPKDKWDEYKKLELRYNKIGSKHFDEIADIFIPQAGMTIAQRDATLRPDALSAQGDIVNRPYSKIDRKSTNIPDPNALTKLISSMQEKLDKSFLPIQIKKAREQLGQMLDTIGNPSLKAKASALTGSQFNVLWNYTNFATNVSGVYFIMQKAASAMDKYSAVVEDYSADIEELFDWAATLQIEAYDPNEDVYDHMGNKLN